MLTGNQSSPHEEGALEEASFHIYIKRYAAMESGTFHSSLQHVSPKYVSGAMSELFRNNKWRLQSSWKGKKVLLYAGHVSCYIWMVLSPSWVIHPERRGQSEISSVGLYRGWCVLHGCLTCKRFLQIS